MSQSSQLRAFSFTAWLPDSEDFNEKETRDKLISRLSTICSRWVFQLERGEESGKLHYQGNCSFKQAKRISEISKALGIQVHAAPISSQEGLDFYCTKDETRIDGPWSDKDKKRYIPRQIREIIDLHPWQKDVIEMSKVWNTRHINVIIDIHGNIGKSTLVQYMRVFGLAKKLPFCNDFKDIMRCAYDMGESPTYMIDIPRAISKERLFQMWGAIEELKGGYCYDDRYKHQDRDFDCPNIWVFLNKEPDEGLLTRDRWMYYMVIDYQLVGKPTR